MVRLNIGRRNNAGFLGFELLRTAGYFLFARPTPVIDNEALQNADFDV
jgi:hypothetical protein